MNKTNIAVIGAGGAGNKMLDVLLSINGVYTPIYANTSFSEMEKMEHIIPERNMLYITNAEGTGRDSELATEVIKQAQPKIVDFLVNKFNPSSGINVFYILCSADGGTGSAMCGLLPKLIKRGINPEAIINLVVAMPNLNEKEFSFRNTQRLLNTIDELYDDDLINSVIYIDNNKMKNEKEFNYQNMSDLNDSLSINNDEIDLIDSKRVNCTKGYKVILRLNPKFKDMKTAIDKAIENTNFLLPNNFDCEHLMATFDEEAYDKEEARNMFEVFGVDKYDYNEDENNMFVLGGCEFPNDYRELINVALQDLLRKKEKREERIIKEKESIKFENPIEKQKEVKKEPKKRNKLTKKDIAKLMNDDDLW